MSLSGYSLSTDFLNCSGRRLFAVNFVPQAVAPRASILFLQPFAEEMHKSRRTVAQQARAFAEAGYTVMLLDLSGCGDSSGDIADASWADWLQDAAQAVSVLRQRHQAPVVLWGLRLGALLACDLSRQTDSSVYDRLLLWQPALNGEQHIDQFLRVELAGQMLKGESGFDRAALWADLRSGRSLHVAGYELTPGLALDIAGVRLGDLTPGCAVHWLDIGGTGAQEPPLPSRTVTERWRTQSVPVQWRSVEGEAFWRNTDAPDSPALLSASVEECSDL